ncbi:MAG: hypothetical protein U0414_32210 [Polyangiaceae bacterium]
MRGSSSSILAWALLFGAPSLAACSSATLRPELSSNAATALALSDALEELIAQGKATEADRDAAYELVKMLPAETAGDAFGHAAITGRVAELKGAGSLFSVDHNPTSLLGEAEHYALLSRQKDSAFRDGAATRMLGSLYCLAPADMGIHGNCEDDGLPLLEGLVKDRPDLAVNQLRLAEAYIAQDDKESARVPICAAREARASLRQDDQGLLDKLLDAMKPFECAKK